MPPALVELEKFREVPYVEVKALRRYLDGHSPFETEHGVKGAEFENVLVVIGRGWNQYNFDEMLELAGAQAVPAAKQLLTLVADERGLDPMLVEKDYWIMHCLWGLQAQGFQFDLKGGTSLSKGFGVIHRFSEDIDIRIEPPDGMEVKAGRNQDKPAHVASRLLR